MNNQELRDDIRQLFHKYIDGSATPEEQKLVEEYYEIFERRADILDQFTTSDINELERRMRLAILNKGDYIEDSRPRIFRKYWVKWVAAASVIFLFAAVYFYLRNETGSEVSKLGVVFTTDLEPGTDKATLILADGSRILLDSADQGVLATQGAITIKMPERGMLEYSGQSKGGDLQYNEIITPAGGQYKLVLSDGSNVWLNAKSSIRFPTSFSLHERNVVITGEAYFEVTKSDIPFRVNVAGRQEVTVLGTQFNINSYEDESDIRTTLMEGSVKVAGAAQNSNSIILIPGQQSALSSSKNIRIENGADVEEAVAWKNGFFQYNNSDLKKIMRQVARWYNVEVRYEGTIPERKFNGKIKRDANASQVLEILGFTGVHFRIEKSLDGSATNKIIVTP